MDFEELNSLKTNEMRDIVDFKEVNVEPDTKILYTELVERNGITAKFELWYWDHINGSSLIFMNEDIEKLTEDELYELCSQFITGFNKKDSTLKKSGQYCFVNYGFSYDK